MCAGRVGLKNEPSINIAREEIGVRDSGNAAVELETSRTDVSPVCIVLVKLVELTTNLDGMPAMDERQDIGDGVNPLAQDGIDVTVPAGIGAQIRRSSPCALINLD